MPRSVSRLLQRVGRSGHRLGATAKGRLFSLTRDELIESAALMFAVRRGELDWLHAPGMACGHPRAANRGRRLRRCVGKGLRAALGAVQRGRAEVLGRDTPLPSAFAHQILNAMPYAFLEDAPIEERRALPDAAGNLGRLSPEAIRRASEDAWPVLRDREQLHDLLLGLILFPETERRRLPADAGTWIDSLCREEHACIAVSHDRRYRVAAERGFRFGPAARPGMVPGRRRNGSRDRQHRRPCRSRARLDGKRRAARRRGTGAAPRPSRARRERGAAAARARGRHPARQLHRSRGGRVLRPAHLRREIEPVPARRTPRVLP